MRCAKFNFGRDVCCNHSGKTNIDRSHLLLALEEYFLLGERNKKYKVNIKNRTISNRKIIKD